MTDTTHDLLPWEVPPDDAYWQALLSEGEFAEEAVTPEGVTTSPDPQPAEFAVQPDDSHDDPEDSPGPVDGERVCWDTFARYQEEDLQIDLPVVGFNRGGLLVKWDGIVGFVPASQLCEGLPYGDESVRRDALAERVGNTLTLKVIEIDAAQERLVLSERAARRPLEPDSGAWEKVCADAVCHGRVTNVCAFGAFVDLGGVEGLIHISELSWGRVSHPSDLLQSGQEIDVYVLNVDHERGRIGLSLKRLQPDPWESVESKYEVSQVLEGTVTNIVKFGAFVRIEEGLEGLVHASEVPNGSLGLHDTLRENDVVRVRVVSIDKERHRMGLSLESDPEGTWD